MRTILPLILLLWTAVTAAADEVVEKEPNDDGKSVTQEIRPGQTFVAEFQKADDQDFVAIVCERETIVSFRWLADEGTLFTTIAIGRLTGRASPGSTRDVMTHRLRLPPGRTVIEAQHRGKSDLGGYRMETRIEEEDATLETEPNGGRQEFTPLALGSPITAWRSSTWSDEDYFRFAIEERGIYRLRLEKLDPPVAPPDEPSAKNRGPVLAKLRLTTTAADYFYAIDELDEIFEFFPVIDPGRYHLQVAIRSGAAGAPYRVTLSRFEVPVTPETTRAAQAAVDRGVRWLIGADQENDKARYNVAASSVALMALCEGIGAEDLEEVRARKVEALVEFLGDSAKLQEGVSWEGEPLEEMGVRIYEHAFATLALAEAAANGSEHARRLCLSGVRFLLASQVSERRPEAWQVEIEAGVRGSWRYTANAEEGDLSVTGWCLIALFAAAAADIEVEGLVQAADWGIEFVKACGVATKGFRYQISAGGNPSSIRQSIGVLVSELFGGDLRGVRSAKKHLDVHLCAGTQGGPGGAYPFYYWYYATRANYLRGGYAWEAWRAVAMEQLVRRQEEDGSWASLHDESDAARRYSTGMAVMILRLCLGDPPHYLSREVRGF